LEVMADFSDRSVCVKYLEDARWRGTVVSPFDKNSKVYKCKGERYYCCSTGKYFNVLTGSMFENTKLPLNIWLVTIWLLKSSKKGISSYQLARTVGITQKTAWFMLHRIRNCFVEENQYVLKNEVEMDETFVGGKNKNRHKDKKVEKCQGRSFKDKTPVFGAVERGGKLIAKVIDDTSYKSIAPIVFNHVDKKATIFTDEWVAYDKIGKLYNRMFVDHSQGQYVEGNATTNTIEGFWSIFKRGVIGVYQKTSKKHLQKYVNEFVWRYNMRNSSQGFQYSSFLSATNHRTKYKELVA
ncbi:MAG: IS1595 family transposase, partial [Lentimicrobiaceae bacterium]|nr:IS1595 family transposase [Lentimicrobiaceae bacterium]